MFVSVTNSSHVVSYVVQDEHLIGFYAFDFDRGRCTDSRLEKLRGKAWSIPWDTIALES